MKKLISKLFFASGSISTSSMLWYGFTFNTATRRGRLGARLPNLYNHIRFAPHTFCWWLSDNLMRAAMRLRGEKPSVFGSYDGCAGNEAARLLDSIYNELIHLLASDDPDKLDDIRLDMNALASLSRAAWARATDEDRTQETL